MTLHRDIAHELLTLWTGRTRDWGDPVYDAVVMRGETAANGGTIGKPSSSCGLLAHALLYSLGCEEPWVLHPGPRWVPGRTITALSPPTCPVSEARPRIMDLDVGDIVVIGMPEHVIVSMEPLRSPAPGRSTPWRTAEYGQPGGRIKTRALTCDQRGGLWVEGRRVMSWISLDRVPMTGPLENAAGWEYRHGLRPRDPAIEEHLRRGSR